MTSKIFCPLAKGECQEDSCVAWVVFPKINARDKTIITNPETGVPLIDGFGCSVYQRILKLPEAKKDETKKSK